MAALKELEVIEGNVQIIGSVSYSSQYPWIFKGTVQENIVFGRRFDHERYDRVVAACLLLHVSVSPFDG